MVWGIFGKTELVMKTEVKNFPKGLDEKDLLYLIWKALLGMQGGSSDGGSEEGSDSSDSDSGSGCSCLAPMIVEGTIDDETVFIPNAGMPSFAEARAYMLDGGQVYMIIDTGLETIVSVATATATEYIAGYDFNWPKPDSESGGEGGSEPSDNPLG